jgi:hypothetical protein
MEVANLSISRILPKIFIYPHEHKYESMHYRDVFTTVKTLRQV